MRMWLGLAIYFLVGSSMVAALRKVCPERSILFDLNGGA